MTVNVVMHQIFAPEEASLLEASLHDIKGLPPTPSIMIKLIDLFRQPDRDIDEVVTLMGQDPALTAEILRRCNSSFFGAEDPIGDFTEAVFRLGFYEVYRITVAMFVQNSAGAARKKSHLNLEALWEHPAVTAIISSVLARELNESEGVLFTSGLLHDVGRIVLALYNGQGYDLLIGEYGECGDQLHVAEKKLFGFDHAQAGAWLLRRWNVPHDIVVPVLQHHETTWTGEQQRISAIVHLADVLSHSIEQEIDEPYCEHPDVAGSVKLLGLDTHAIKEIGILSRREIKRLLPALSAVPKN